MNTSPALRFVLAAWMVCATASALAQGGPGTGGAARRGGDAGAGPVQTIEQRTASLTKKDGFLPLYLDEKTGRIYLEIAKFDTQFLYELHSANGTGAGVSRGAISKPYVVKFSRIGPKVLLTAENFTWRTTSTDPNEQRAVKESFPESVLAGFTVAAEDAPDHVLVDATDFFLRDAGDFADRMGAGYRLDLTRSAIVPENTKVFPKNDEVETLLTFTSEGGRAGAGAGLAAGPSLGGRAGGLGAVAPDEKNVTVRARQSLIELPPPGFKPRIWDPRSGFLLNVEYSDWSKPLGEPRETHFLTRHRLIKKNPNAPVSDPVEPIVYYVDPGAPEPVRTALVEGARWWSEAFLAAGFSNAFKVELLPPGADPYDVRYNMILWVEEEQRGFSNGANIVDPRTGEIIKGEVTLTAGRERQDYLITDALLSPYKTSGKPDPQQEELVKQRIRQLSAHETGHTLGVGHNHAASSFSENGSVEDYPFPHITLDKNGKLDFSHAYPTGIGDWDKISITYGYKEFPPGTTPEQEKAALDKILDDAHKKGMYFITDSGTNSVSPHSSQWDNGPNSAAELDRLLQVREVAMKTFSEAAIRPGEPMATLEDVLVPVYLLHRYQTEAAVQSIGGEDYRYAVRGDGQTPAKMVPADEQKAALTAVLKTLDPVMLTLPESLLEKFPPRPPSYPRTQESFEGYAGVAFDPMAPVLAAADITLDGLFEGPRATRLVEEHARDASIPGLDDVIEQTLKATFYAPLQKGLAGESQMTINGAVLDHLTALSTAAGASPVAKAVVAAELAKLRAHIADLAKDPEASPEQKAFYASLGGGGGGGRAGAGAAGAATGAGAAAGAAGGRGAGRGGESSTSIPAGAPIEPDLTFMPQKQTGLAPRPNSSQ
jgi:hypothetical protein